MPRMTLALAALLCLAAPGRADWLTIGFVGVADYASGADLARLGLAPGAAVSGTVRYQATPPPNIPLMPATNDVVTFLTLGSMTVHVGGYTFTAGSPEPPAPGLPWDDLDRLLRAEVRLPDSLREPPPEDFHSLNLYGYTPAGGAGDLLSYSVTFNRADGRPVGGHLPADLSPFVGGEGSFYLMIDGPGPGGQDPDTTSRLWLTGTMVGVTATPEPGTLALAGLGAGAGLLAWGRRRSRGRIRGGLALGYPFRPSR